MREDMLSQLEEIQSNVREIKSTWGKTIMTLDNIKSSLKADRQKALEEARKKGYEEAEMIWTAPSSKNEFYRKGLDDAWEAARKIVLSPYEGGMSLADLFAIFGIVSMQQFFRKYSASQAIEKLKAYELNDKVEVGDEVKPSYSDIAGVVTLIDGDTIYVLWRDGSSTSTLKLKEVRKTGRHFEIESILREMSDES